MSLRNSPDGRPAPVDPRITLVETFKGGTGKTTSALWFARAFANLGQPTLLVGLSPQNDVVPIDAAVIAGLREALLSGTVPRASSVADRLWHVPAGLADLGAEDLGVAEAIRTCARQVGATQVVVDGINLLQPVAFHVLRQSNLLVIPTSPFPAVLAAALRTLRLVSTLPAESRPWAKILLTLVPPPSARTATVRELMELLRDAYPGFVFAQEIRRTARFDAVPLDPNHQFHRGRPTGPNLSADYHAAAREALAILGGEVPDLEEASR